MFYQRPKKVTLKSLLKDYNEYKALKQFYIIFNNYINVYKELNLQLINHNSLLNIIRKRKNYIHLGKKSYNISQFWVSTDQMRDHVMRLGGTGVGKSEFFYSVSKHSSIVVSDKTQSELMIKNIDKNELDGFISLSVIMNEDYEILIQYKGNKLFIYVYFTHPDYFVQLNYTHEKLDSFYSSFNQNIDITSNNIVFLLNIEKFNNDFKDILEQDISIEDKITLANMLNI